MSPSHYNFSFVFFSQMEWWVTCYFGCSSMWLVRRPTHPLCTSVGSKFTHACCGLLCLWRWQWSLKTDRHRYELNALVVWILCKIQHWHFYLIDCIDEADNCLLSLSFVSPYYFYHPLHPVCLLILITGVTTLHAWSAYVFQHQHRYARRRKLNRWRGPDTTQREDQSCRTHLKQKVLQRNEVPRENSVFWGDSSNRQTAYTQAYLKYTNDLSWK